MDISDVYKFFQSSPEPQYLNVEQAICYISKTLLEDDRCAAELLCTAKSDTYDLSPAVLSKSIKILLKNNVIKSYDRKTQGRGRPKKMFALVLEKKPQAQELANFWNEMA